MRFVFSVLLFLSCSCSSLQLGREAVKVWEIHRGINSASAVPVDCRLVGESYVVTFLTARHLADAKGTLSVRQRETLWRGVVVTRHPTLDAALVKFRCDSPVEILALRFSSPVVGESVWVSGYGGGLGHLWISRGIVSSDTRATCPVFFGDSGGAVLDSHMRVTGIVRQIGGYNVFGDRRPVYVFHHCSFVPVRDLREWIEMEIER